VGCRPPRNQDDNGRVQKAGQSVAVVRRSHGHKTGSFGCSTVTTNVSNDYRPGERRTTSV
jgi:hypothetical protein